MACYHPNLMQFYAKKGEEPAWHFVGKYDGSLHRSSQKIAGRRVILDNDTGEVSFADTQRTTLVPCGQCRGCRIDRSRDWANRMMLEKMQYADDECWFLTLTYDDAHAPMNDIGSLTLVPADVSRFMKRLRTFSGRSGIRFFAAGEYGEHTFRPHYHLIVYGLPGDLLQAKPYGASDQGYKYYRSDLIEKAWSVDGVPLGFHSLTQVTWETCAYTARYVVKKLTGEASDFYKKNQIAPEFCRMSLKPGIGKQYYVDHVLEIYENDSINLSTSTRGRKFKPPRYFDRLFEKEYPSYFERVKDDRRRSCEDVLDFKLDNFDGSYLEMIAAEEAEFIKKTKILKRGDPML